MAIPDSSVHTPGFGMDKGWDRQFQKRRWKFNALLYQVTLFLHQKCPQTKMPKSGQLPQAHALFELYQRWSCVNYIHHVVCVNITNFRYELP